MWQIDADEWWHCMDVNLRGPFLCAKAVLPGMVRRQRGRIVITGSNAGLQPMRYGSAYGVSKCAVIRLAETLAVETAEHGISVFALYPGFVRTAFTEWAAASPEFERWLGGAFRRGLAEGHDVSPEHAARLVTVLASGRADSLSGCYVSIGDDVREMVRRADEIEQDELYKLRLRT
jgi:NAD(P)-dependent dehydrogenase (short-subunit alcohol dehydrogenase family)